VFVGDDMAYFVWPNARPFKKYPKKTRTCIRLSMPSPFNVLLLSTCFTVLDNPLIVIPINRDNQRKIKTTRRFTKGGAAWFAGMSKITLPRSIPRTPAIL